MSEVTVKQMAQTLNLNVDKLLVQLSEAGMKFSGPDQVVTSAEKIRLLGFLRRAHGKQEAAVESPSSAPRQITLRRTRVTELTVPSGATRGKTVAVEVRAKRTYVKRDTLTESQQPTTEREEALKLLQASEARRSAEETSLIEKDQRRKDEQERLVAEAAAKAAAAAAEAAQPEPPVGGEPETGAADVRADKDKPRRSVGPVKPAAAVVPPRRDDSRGRDEPHRHKGNRGSHRMQDNDLSVVDPTVGRYLHGPLHLADGAARRSRKKSKPRIEPSRSAGTGHGFSRPSGPMVRAITVGDTIVVADLAVKLAIKGAEVVRMLFKMGVMTTINQAIDHDTAVLVVEELGHTATRQDENDAETALIAHAVSDVPTEPRPPVVTIMGHVDHGKTSLLDYIRRTKVASGEAGGITQHIGAYHVETDRGVISFLDTPGHAAFTSMRSRGAKLTDIVVLVVAADDGVMPQTIEAIQHARAAKVPLIVAINKMDKGDADPDRVKQDLLAHEVVAEEYGGDVQMVPLSARTGAGVDALLDALSLQAEVLELKAPIEGRASGAVIESTLDKGRGPVATVLVQSGTLKRGDYMVCGVEYGRVRALFDENGKQVESALPSIPVVVIGLSGVPRAGDDFVVVADERLAKDVARQREEGRRESHLSSKAATNRFEDILAQMGKGEGQQTLNLVIKADVHGSSEALRESLTSLSTDLIRINVLSSGVGGLTEKDATLAAASKAVLIGFNVRADASARRIVESGGIDLRYFSIIYDVIDQVKQVASGMLGVEIREEIIGTAQVRDVFRSSKFGAIAGCMVIEGVVKRSKPIRVLRDNTVVFQGELESLRRFKENVDEVRNGTECGIGVKAYNDVKAGDQIECFERHEIQRTL